MPNLRRRGANTFTARLHTRCSSSGIVQQRAARLASGLAESHRRARTTTSRNLWRTARSSGHTPGAHALGRQTMTYSSSNNANLAVQRRRSSSPVVVMPKASGDGSPTTTSRATLPDRPWSSRALHRGASSTATPSALRRSGRWRRRDGDADARGGRGSWRRADQVQARVPVQQRLDAVTGSWRRRSATASCVALLSLECGSASAVSLL